MIYLPYQDRFSFPTQMLTPGCSQFDNARSHVTFVAGEREIKSLIPSETIGEIVLYS